MAMRSGSLTWIYPRAWVYPLGSFFYAGSFPRLRGTIGTFIPAAALWPIEAYAGWSWWWTLIAAAGVLGIGVPLANAAEQRDGAADPPWFVLDEVFGVLLTLTGLTALTGASPALTLLVVFVVFRGFDAFKPPPIRAWERRIPGGWGVMLDDAFAALYAWPVGLATLYSWAWLSG